MKVLIIKTSSMGDVIHTLPALTDAGKIYPDIRFDWVVEEAFAEIPGWHPLVEKVIPIAWRRWRKKIVRFWHNNEWKQFQKQIKASEYDLIIDAQGLLKSAVFMCFAKGLRVGFNFNSARESLAALFYQRRIAVNPNQHAIDRVRQLFAQALNYSVSNNEPVYNINPQIFNAETAIKPYVVFIHGTTWKTKEWPKLHWINLAMTLTEKGYQIKIPWGNEEELKRAEAIANIDTANITVLPKYNLNKLAGVMQNAKAIIAVDTGLGHLAAALAIPTISLYGPTHPDAIGTRGANQIHLSTNFNCQNCNKEFCNNQKKKSTEAACLTAISAEMVLNKLEELLMFE